MAEIDVATYDAVRDLPACRLRAVSAGRLAVLKGGRRTGLTIPIVAYLLDTGSELLAIDAGLSARWREAAEVHLGPEDSPSPGTPYSPELVGPTMAEQLDALGLAPSRLVCTHLHEDHSSGAAGMGLTLEASTAELARLGEPGAEAMGYPVEELAAVARAGIDLDPTAAVGPFAASAVLADGVLAVDTSGHTPGSISVLARVGEGWALVCGDAVYPRLDQPASTAFRGMLRIRRAIQDLPGLRVFPGHDTSALRAGAADGWVGA
ncbi:MAG: N-acyl homoserine lactone hydrolase [Chloroflexota bacterium]|jgi:glyoxylase-like metal-dependent hydrolase (beta-lactamase superfamily II)|nr:N-acyl homoserine lactone hydrolase [Chloroflexota bacterium]